jgi:membrane-associated protein
MSSLLHDILHLDTYLITFVSTYGGWTYLVLFTIIFCETGLVFTPFLPGDSLLFAAGAIAAHETTLNIRVLFLLLTISSIFGNKMNYLIGRFLGPRLFSSKKGWLFQQKHLEEAHRFYEKHGGKAILLARFIPIIRTFVPFVAGMATMRMRQFSICNIISALLWVSSLLLSGTCLLSNKTSPLSFT